MNKGKRGNKDKYKTEKIRLKEKQNIMIKEKKRKGKNILADHTKNIQFFDQLCDGLRHDFSTFLFKLDQLIRSFFNICSQTLKSL